MNLPNADSMMGLVLRAKGFSSRFLKTRLGTIHFYEKRHPQPKGVLVFVHGIGASAGHYSRVVGPLWKQGYTVLIPDLSAHGQSPEPLEKLTPEVFFQVFVEWVSTLVPEPFYLIGNSLGGALSLRFALEYPERVKKLILASPAGGFADEKDWDDFRKGLRFTTLQECKLYLDRIYHRKPIYLPLFYPLFQKIMTRSSIQGMIDQCTVQEFRLDRGAQKEIRLPPTLLIWGKSERIFPAAHLAWFKKSLPSHVIVDEPDETGHCPQFDSPEWFWKRIHDFIQKGK